MATDFLIKRSAESQMKKIQHQTAMTTNSWKEPSTEKEGFPQPMLTNKEVLETNEDHLLPRPAFGFLYYCERVWGEFRSQVF